MDAIDLLRNRASAINQTTHMFAERLEGLDLGTPLLPGTSPIGLTLWHIVRAQDWIVQTVIRGVDEVADSGSGAGLPDHRAWGIGIGLTAEQAAEIAGAVTLDAVVGYADEVFAELDGWLDGLDAGDLDSVPDWSIHQEQRPVYAAPAYFEEAGDLHGKPVGVLLARPAITHNYVHFGEMDLLLQFVDR